MLLAVPSLMLQPVLFVPTAFFVSCWTGSLTHVYWSELRNQPVIPLCGASGGIYGLFVAALLSTLKIEDYTYRAAAFVFYFSLHIVIAIAGASGPFGFENSQNIDKGRL